MSPQFIPGQIESRYFSFFSDGAGNLFNNVGGVIKQGEIITINLGPPQLDYPWQIQNIISSWNTPVIKTELEGSIIVVTENFKIDQRLISSNQRTKIEKEALKEPQTGGLSQLQFYPTILRERQQLTYDISCRQSRNLWNLNSGLILEGEFSLSYAIQQL